MSAAIASERPAPTATPLIPATTGLSVSSRRREQEAADPAVLVEELLLLRQARLDLVGAARTEVETRAERVTVAGDRDDAHVVVGIGALDGGDDPPAERPGERVLALGSVESEHADVANVDLLER